LNDFHKENRWSQPAKRWAILNLIREFGEGIKG